MYVNNDARPEKGHNVFPHDEASLFDSEEGDGAANAYYRMTSLKETAPHCSQVLKSVMEKNHCKAPPDWQGFRELTNK